MLRIVTFTMLIFITAVEVASKGIVLVDSHDGSAVAGASALASDGIIVGISDADGMIDKIENAHYPITLRSLGYEPLTVDRFCDTVRLRPASYFLPEVTVSPGERPVRRVLSYVREYCTGASANDTIQMYCDYMIESYVVDDGSIIKGYDKYHSRPYVKAARRYARITDGQGRDSLMSPKASDDITMLSWMENISSVPVSAIEIRPAILAGAESDTIYGKYGPKTICRKIGELYIESSDFMSDHKDHVWSPAFFKLLGLTMDMRQLRSSVAYNISNSGHVGLNEFVYGTYGIELLAKGKWFKKWLSTKEPILMNCYIELYPIEITNHSVAEYKELRRDKNTIAFVEPANVQPLSQAIRSLIERIETQTTN